MPLPVMSETARDPLPARTVTDIKDSNGVHSKRANAIVRAKLKLTGLTLAIALMFASVADALSGTYVVLAKGGGGLAVFFTEKGTFSSVAYNPRNKRKRYKKGTYTVAGNRVAMKTSQGETGAITIEPNGDLYDKGTNLRLHRYYRRKS